MRLFRTALFAAFAACAASAFAQYGMYGSPDVLPVPQQAPSPNYQQPAGYPTTAGYQAAPTTPPTAPAAQPAGVYYPNYAPAQPQRTAYRAPNQYQQNQYQQNQYQPQRYAGQQYPAQRYPGQAYPAQPAAVAGYQPYQPGAQYQYPGPAYQPTQQPAQQYQQPMQQYQPAYHTAAAERPIPTPAMPVPPNAPAGAAPEPTMADEPAAQQDPGVTNQMLAEQQNYQDGYNGNGYPGAACNGPYGGAMTRFDQAACGPAGCGEGGYCGPDNCCRWYASASAIFMGRSDARRVWTSYATTDETNQLTNTQFGMKWQPGGEITFGHRFCYGCIPYALEATFWTTEPLTGYRSTTYPGGVSTPLAVSPMMFGAEAAQNWFDGAAEHRLWRRDEFYNLEVNLIREQIACGCDSPWQVGWLAGLRYFRFQEELTFGSLRSGGTWGANGGADEAYFSDNITNDLLGVQIGFDVEYNLACGLRLFITPKIGLYNNFLDGTFQAHTGSGVNGSGPYGAFPVHSTTNGLAFLTEIDVGGEWQFARNWSLRAGYRVVAITGTGLADDQFPQYMVDTPDIANIQHSSSLVLHGAFAGLNYCF